jgi:predicted permease
MAQLLDDIRFGARSLRRTPGFTLVALLTLALGIGATAAMFTVFNSLLLRPLAYPDPEQLVRIYQQNPRQGWFRTGVIGPVYAAWRDGNRTFQAVETIAPSNGNLTGLEQPVEITMAAVSPGFFTMLGESPILGRPFSTDEYRRDGPPVVLLSRAFWVTRFGADSTLIGRTITLNDQARTVVGVMPDGEVTNELEAWVPFPDVYRELSFGNHFLTVIGRLRPGVTLETATRDLTTIGAAVLAEGPAPQRDWGPELVSLQDSIVGATAPSIRVLLWAVGLVLLIACANVANLTMVRAHGRQREVALRAALGAGRRRIARALVTESAILAVGGAAAGLVAATWGIDAILAFAPENFPRRETVAIDGWVLGFTALVTGAAVVLFGALPAIRSSRVDLQATLRSGGGSSGRSRVRDGLAVAEIALALILTTGAGLLLKSLVRLQSVELGYDPRGVVALDLDLPGQRYRQPEQRIQLIHQVEELIRAVPGVRAVGTTRALPLESGGPDTEFDIVGRASASSEGRAWAFYTPITAGYHQTMGVRLLAGRLLSQADDRTDAPRVVVVNETLARRYWPEASPVGARIGLGQNVEAEIVGVVGDLRQRFLADDVRPAIFVPFSHATQVQTSMVVRAVGDPIAVLPLLQQAVWQVDPNLPVEQWSMFDLMRTATARPRFNATLFGVLAGLAVVLAIIGVYGVVSFTVALRRREIGVRMALGARAGDVATMVIRQGGLLAAIGVAIGLGGSVALSGLVTKLLYGVRPVDPATLGSATAVVVVVLLAACLIPARRAAREQPTAALRLE